MISGFLFRLRALASSAETDGETPSSQLPRWLEPLLIAVMSPLIFYVATRRGHFTYDQAYFYEMSFRAADAFRVPAWGPFVSGFVPAPLIPGGLMYPLLGVPFFFGASHPFAGLAWIHLLTTTGVWLMSASLKRLGAPGGLRLAYVALTMFAVSYAREIQTFWNGDLFWFISPLTIFQVVVWARPSPVPTRLQRWHLDAVLLGLSFALATQVHLGGAMLVPVTLGWLWLTTPGALTWLRLLGIVAGLTLGYVPWVAGEMASNWENLALLRQASPRGGLTFEPIWRTLIMPVMQVSHASETGDAFVASDWVSLSKSASIWVAVGLSTLGLFTRHRFKLAVLLMWVATAAFFTATRRPYMDHYVGAMLPLAVMLPAAGLARLAQWRRAGSAVALAYLALLGISGVALLKTQIDRPVLTAPHPYFFRGVDAQLQFAAQLPVGAAVSPGDDQAFVSWVLAHRVLHRELTFSIDGHRCTPDVLHSGLGQRADPPGTLFAPLGPNSVLVCAKP